MINKVILGTFLLAGFLFVATGSVFAETEASPWESMSRFRGEDKLSARDMEISKKDFYAHRDEMREQHREGRMLQRAERLQDAVARGCITEEEMENKMQTRNGRFSR
jgi:hypothetical protein